MILSILTLVILVFIYALLKRKNQNQNMGDRGMYGKNKSLYEPIEKKQEEITTSKKPVTKRSASGCNWKAYKDIIHTEESSYDKKKNNSTKKSSNKSQKFKKSNVSLLETGNTMKEEKKYDHTVPENNKKITKLIAIDCEMVGIGDGSESMIARVSIVNKFGYCLYDKYVKPREKVQDYRTAVSGIYPHHLKNGEEFSIVQKEVADILKGRILVGHALKNDLAVLFLSHPWKSLRDTSRYKPFRQITKANTPSLKRLASELLGIEIQVGEHNSVEDARAAMQLYMLYRTKWEAEIYSRR